MHKILPEVHVNFVQSIFSFYPLIFLSSKEMLRISFAMN